MLAHTPLVEASLRPSLAEVAQHATEGGLGTVFYKAIFGGWLVALMASLVSSTRYTGAQIAFVWLTTATISALGFKHSIAGAVEAFYRAATGAATWGDMVGGFVVPAVLGNLVGGGLLVALVNHKQVDAGGRQGRSRSRRRPAPGRGGKTFTRSDRISWRSVGAPPRGGAPPGRQRLWRVVGRRRRQARPRSRSIARRT